MKYGVAYYLEVFVEADGFIEATEKAGVALLRARIVEHLNENGIDARVTHDDTHLEPEKDDVVGFPVFDESRGRHDPDV